MWDQPHGEAVARHLRHGERDAVDRDRALVHEVAAEARRRGNAEIVILPTRLEDLDASEPVDMAADKMPAETPGRLEAALGVLGAVLFKVLGG